MSKLQNSIKIFGYYKSMGEKAMSQISDASLFDSPGPDLNSISNLVKHLRGNMLSRWTDFPDADGEKEWRHRDAEFEDAYAHRIDLMQAWDEGWNCLFVALEGLGDRDLKKHCFIRGQKHTIEDAIERQVAHYAYHVGQIVLLARQRASQWTSLSIPRGRSHEFNKEIKYSKHDRDRHFTDLL